MTQFWWIAFCVSVAYVVLVALGRKHPVKVAPAVLLAISVHAAGPLAVVALLFCALGDAFLLAKDRYFLHGLGAFLVGHVLLVAVFIARAAEAVSLPLAIGMAVVAGGVLAALWTKLTGVLRVAVPVYALALGAMVVTAGAVSPVALAGAVTFVVSDSVLSITRFVRAFPGSEIVVMSTYYAAILMIASALGG